MQTATSTNYDTTLFALKERIREAQRQALKAVNKELIELYWHIGKIIAEQQEKEKWGNSVVERLARDLQIEFPGIRGFSTLNLWRMKRFYDTYVDNQKLSPLVKEIGWSHNIIIFKKCTDNLRQEFYLKSSIREGWSKRMLEQKLATKEFEKWALNQTNFKETLFIQGMQTFL